MPESERPISEVMLEIIQRYLKAGDFTNTEQDKQNDQTD